MDFIISLKIDDHYFELVKKILFKIFKINFLLSLQFRELKTLLEFGDPNSICFNPKSLRCDICGEAKLVRSCSVPLTPLEV